ncbi:MAG: helix-turn-helix domain-containing protein [Ruminococcus sp.]|nr:helix-turn-helix domain-containing protein [Ruminococcus sp.]
MAEYTFKSNLSIEEIENNFNDIDFFEGVKSGLEEALAFEKGRAAAETFARKSSLPQVNVSELRHSLSLTQKAFAALLGVSTRTVEAWEVGKSTPTPTAKKLLFLIQKEPSLVQVLQNA